MTLVMMTGTLMISKQRHGEENGNVFSGLEGSDPMPPWIPPTPPPLWSVLSSSLLSGQVATRALGLSLLT